MVCFRYIIANNLQKGDNKDDDDNDDDNNNNRTCMLIDGAISGVKI